MENNNLLNSFVLEYRKEAADRNVAQYKSVVEASVFGAFNEVKKIINPKVYINYLQKSVDSLNSITENTEEMDAFFTKVYKSAYLGDKKITMPFQPDDKIDKFRYAYLETVVRDFTKAVKKILEGSKSQNDIYTKYVSSEYVDKMKKQLVKSDYTSVDVRDLMKLDSPSVIAVNNVFIQNNVIPFVRNYRSNVADITAIALNTAAMIDKCMNEIDTIVQSINTMKASQVEGADNTGKITDPKVISALEYTAINFTSSFLDMTAYLCAMIIRKISYYTFNMTSVTTLKNTILNFFPEGELILHESVMNGDISDIDDSELLRSVFDRNDMNIIIPHIQSAVNRKKMEISNILAKKFNRKINFDEEIDSAEYPFDKNKYIAIWNVLKEISHSIDLYTENIKDEQQIPDEIITNSGLEETFVSKYANAIADFDNVGFYISQEAMVEPIVIAMCLFNEISHFEEVAEKLAHNLNVIYLRINALKKEFEINSLQMDDTRYNELKSFTETLMTRYKDFSLQVIKKMLARLDALTDILEDADLDDDVATPEPYVPYEDNLKVAEEKFKEIEEAEEAAITELSKQHYAYMREKTDGVKVVFEEVQPGQAATAGATGGNQKKPSTTPKVSNNPDAVANTQQVKQDDTDATTDEKKTTKSGRSLIEQVVKRIQEVIKMITDKFKQNFENDTYKKELEAAKEYFNDYGEQKTTEMLPFTHVNRQELQGILNKAATAVQNVNVQNPGASLGKTYHNTMTKLCSSIASGVGYQTTNKGDKAAMKKAAFNWLCTENAAGTSPTTYTGKDSKNRLVGCYDFYKSYGSDIEQLKTAAQNFGQKAAEKAQELRNGENDKISPETGNSPTYSDHLTKCTEVIIESVLEAYDQRLTDSIRVLRAFLRSVEPNYDKKNKETNPNPKEG